MFLGECDRMDLAQDREKWRGSYKYCKELLGSKEYWEFLNELRNCHQLLENDSAPRRFTHCTSLYCIVLRKWDSVTL